MNPNCSNVVSNGTIAPCEKELKQRQFSLLLDQSFYNSWEEYTKTQQILFGEISNTSIQYPKEFLNTIRLEPRTKYTI